MVALEPDRGDTVFHREALGIDLPFLLDRPAGSVDHPLHAEVPDSGRPLVRIMRDRAEEPEAGVGDADEIAAWLQEAQCRQRAEIA